MTKKNILAIAAVMSVGEFLAVAGFMLMSEHDLALGLILGIPAAILMFVTVGAMLTVVFVGRRRRNL